MNEEVEPTEIVDNSMDEDVALERPVVIDNGSTLTRAGFAGDDQPVTVFPTIVGRPRRPQPDDSAAKLYFGEDAETLRHKLTCKYPIEWGIVTNWPDMEPLWSHTLHKLLRVDPKERPVFLTEMVRIHKANREQAAQIMFEKFEVPYLYTGSLAVSSLYSTGRSTGLVVECGQGICHTVPVYEGVSYRYGVLNLDMGGQDITNCLRRLLNKKGYSFTTTAEYKIVVRIKEKLCYVANNFKLESKQAGLVRSYQLPNGALVKLDTERFKAPEAFFQPTLIGMESNSLVETAYNSILRCPKDMQEELFQNIIIAGRSANFPGFPERMEKELKAMTPNTDIRVSAPNPSNSTWHGAAKLAAQPDFLDMCISREEYDEHGPALVHKKCFS